MTAYEAVGVNLTTGLSVVPVTWQLQIVSVQVTNKTASSQTMELYKYTSSTLSGGASVTPIALRDGANSALATAKTGATPSGTAHFMTNLVAAVGQTSTYQFPSNVLCAPGNVFHVSDLTGGSVTVVIVFDELHLARST